MSTTEHASSNSAATVFKPLRRWIPLLILPVMIAARFVADVWTEGPSWTWAVTAFLPAVLSLVLIFWWLLLSRARVKERFLGMLGIIVILITQQLLSHETMRGPVFIVMTVPLTIGAFALGLILFGRQLTARRTAIALVFAAVAASVSMFLRNDGVWGDFSFELLPRWSESSDESIATISRPEGTQAIPTDMTLESSWPSFRGPMQDGTVRGGLVLDPDWAAHPPKQLWRVPVGPAWSSFVSVNNYLFTQEQRVSEEAVVCYESESGRQVWATTWPSRFFEALGGLGPRSTPAYADGSIYALGADGVLVRLNVHDGSIVWQADIKKSADRKDAPMWGFSASPLVVNDLVIVHAGGKSDKGVLAFHATDGKLAWSVASGEQSYGSAQAVTVLGQPLIALLSETGAQFWDTTGQSVLDYSWPHSGYRALQPQIIDGDKLLIPTGMGTGTRLVQLRSDDGKLSGEEIWTSRDLKPDFNDVVVHKGYIYGFDNRIFTCIDLSNGKRKWKGGRYEKGQALLSANSNLILVVAETGGLFLLRANPEQHEELAQVPALSDKTWNHPILIGDRLFLRNATEAVAYQLPVQP